MKHWLWAIALPILLLPIPAPATTASDLSGRIRVDGDLSDYAADEWILDAVSARPERPADSQWGPGNDIRRVALTWDQTYLYIAIDCVTSDAGVMAWLELGGGGLRDLSGAGPFRRSIVLGSIVPNILAWADVTGSVDAARVSASSALHHLDESELPRAFARAPDGTAVLEMAYAWAKLPSLRSRLSLLTAITGGVGTGSGDAAPDPSGTLSSRREATAALDQVLRVLFDADGDRIPDDGVSPRAVTEIFPGNDAATTADARVTLNLVEKAFAPEHSEEMAFGLAGAGESVVLFLTCRVYSVGGRFVRQLYADDYRLVQQGDNPADPRDRWDGRDESGSVVPGGIYIVNLSWGQSRGAQEASARKSVVIVR